MAEKTYFGMVLSGGGVKIIDVVPTLTTHAAYVANDYVGEDHVAMVFLNAARVLGGSGIVIAAELVDYVVASVAAELWLFDTAPAGLDHDSAAFTITDADAARCIGVIPFTNWYASALNSVSAVGNLTLGFTCLAGSQNIYGALVTRGAPAYAASGDVRVRLHIMQC